jgi:hypothetical protein
VLHSRFISFDYYYEGANLRYKGSDDKLVRKSHRINEST